MSAKIGNRSLGSSHRLPANFCWRVFGILLEELATQVTKTCASDLRGILRKRDAAGYIAYGDLNGLQSMTRWGRPEPGNPASVRLLCSVLRKHIKLETVPPARRKSEAIQRSVDCDQRIKLAEDLESDPVLVAAREFCQATLGSAPDVDSIAVSARHGPGSSVRNDFAHRSGYFKYSNWPYAVTPRAKDLLIDVIKLDPRWVGSLEDDYRKRYRIPPWNVLNQDVFWANVVNDSYNFNRLTSVPKDGTKDRPIAIEPEGNLFLQLGIDGIFRSRLRAVGNSIDDQSRNRELALSGSADGTLATIDLSDASDTVSLDICQKLLSPEWFRLLCRVRSPFGELPEGTGWRYAKMSSMGNATTFVLETLLFLSLSKGISTVYGRRSDRVAVFGDDIICEAYLYNHHLAYLQAFGFRPNAQKSFGEGRVRESCGIDAFDGVDIRPVFLKEDPSNAMEVYRDRNRLHRWFRCHTGSDSWRLDGLYLDCLPLAPHCGPETDDEFDTYWHVPDFPRIAFTSITRRSCEIRAEKLGFRKLMHDLYSCTSEGGRFAVQEASVGKFRLVHRAPPTVRGYAGRGPLESV